MLASEYLRLHAPAPPATPHTSTSNTDALEEDPGCRRPQWVLARAEQMLAQAEQVLAREPATPERPLFFRPASICSEGTSDDEDLAHLGESLQGLARPTGAAA